MHVASSCYDVKSPVGVEEHVCEDGLQGHDCAPVVALRVLDGQVVVLEHVVLCQRCPPSRHPREYVFANFAEPGTPWTTQCMSNRMGAVLPGKKLGSALLSKIAITEFAKHGKGSSEALAKAMRHKLETS